jgi:3-hydroxybutyryl-CoA dehydratase
MPRGLYFEDLEVGQTYTTAARTVTEADIVNFAGVSGDFNPAHTDAEQAREGQFGQRIAHGLLGLSIASGQAFSLGFFEGTIIAWTGLDWKFRAPIFIGDTIHTTTEVKKLQARKSVGGGFVTLEIKVVNQNGDTTQKGTWTIIVKSREAEEEAAE